ncbi:MAG: precorrin-2 C(20)-methyltransferase [Desulfobulbaceae bacterium]|nr:precorrin-2 C(20)-methyltransferase [Desulfobulbaceae bacterium]
MAGRFFVIGVGPGDPELVTMKAARILRESPVWFVPRGHQDGESTALAIVEPVVDSGGKEVMNHYFPMKRIHRGETPDPEVAEAWRQAAEAILVRIRQGDDVAFPTLGDPAIYSTGFYVCETLLAQVPDLHVEIIPGVSAIGASAAAAGQPLCLGNERLVVIPATFENGRLQGIIEQFDTIVLMKVHRVMDRVLALLGEMDLLEHAVLVERSSQSGQRITKGRHLLSAPEPHYFSTIIVRKS